jgi:hypothetical protein
MAQSRGLLSDQTFPFVSGLTEPETQSALFSCFDGIMVVILITCDDFGSIMSTFVMLS